MENYQDFLEEHQIRSSANRPIPDHLDFLENVDIESEEPSEDFNAIQMEHHHQLVKVRQGEPFGVVDGSYGPQFHIEKPGDGTEYNHKIDVHGNSIEYSIPIPGRADEVVKFRTSFLPPPIERQGWAPTLPTTVPHGPHTWGELIASDEEVVVHLMEELEEMGDRLYHDDQFVIHLPTHAKPPHNAVLYLLN